MITKRTLPKVPTIIRLFPLLLLPAMMTPAAEISWVEDAIIQHARKAVVKILMPPSSHLKNIIAAGDVSLDAAQRMDTGFFATPDGLVVLSAAGLEGTSKITLVLHDGRQVEDAKLLAVDPLNDLAVIRTGVAAPHFLVGAARQPAPGTECAALAQGGQAVADGVLLAFRGTQDWTYTRAINVWSVALNPKITGLTGAPIIDNGGNLVAMCDLVKFSGGKAPQTFVFAFPSQLVTALLENARKAVHTIPFPKPGEITSFGFLRSIRYWDGMVALNKRDYPAAEQAFQAALIEQPDHPLILQQLAGSQHDNGDLSTAILTTRRLLRVYPTDMQAAINLGTRLAQEQAGLESTLDYFRKLSRQHPKSGNVAGILGVHLTKAGQLEEALPALKQWTELEPDNMEAWRVYADTLLEAGKPAEYTTAQGQFNELESLFFKLRYSSPKHTQ